jgi:magnesium-transporting ATPase (P-type)
MDRQEQRQVRCLRDGASVSDDVDELVPGDVVMLEAGEVVPADRRLLAERSSMLYEGTVVAVGEARALVVPREMSESHHAQYLQPIAVSGVEARLDHITTLTLPVAAFSGIAVMMAGLARQRPVNEVVGAGVSLAVAAVPEGLPLLATMVQLAAAGRLSRIGAIARNPRAIEALGRMTVLCADKTGTLAEGALSLRMVVLDCESQAIDSLDEAGREVLAIGIMASPQDSAGNGLVHLTDDTVLSAARAYNEDLLVENSHWSRIRELPFRSELGYHATLAELNGERRICVKGAPDILAPLCDRWQRANGSKTRLSAGSRRRIIAQALALAEQGYRVLAVAEREAAIRMAEVGIALGERSTAAARAAADLLVVDGRIETIVAAVMEGRALWSSVREALALLLVNLLTDTFPSLAVALRRPQGVTPQRASTVALLMLVGSQVGQAVTAGRGSREVVLTALGTWICLATIVQVPGLSGLFGCRPLGPMGWSQALASIGIAMAGSAWMPELQAWLVDKNSQRVLQSLRQWLAEEDQAA